MRIANLKTFWSSMKKAFLIFVLTLLVFGPSFIFAQDELTMQDEAQPGYLIVCSGPEGVATSSSDYDPCTITDLFELINKLVNFLIFVALFISIIVFMYAGVLYLMSTDKSDQTKRAKEMMLKTVKGIIVILIAWVLIYSALNLLGLKEEYNYLGNGVDQPEP